MEWLKKRRFNANEGLFNANLIQELNLLFDLILKDDKITSPNELIAEISRNVVEFINQRRVILHNATVYIELHRLSASDIPDLIVSKNIAAIKCDNTILQVAEVIDEHLKLLSISVCFNAFDRLTFLETVALLAESLSDNAEMSRSFLHLYSLHLSNYCVLKTKVIGMPISSIDVHISTTIQNITDMITPEMTIMDAGNASFLLINGSNSAFQGFPSILNRILPSFSTNSLFDHILCIQLMAIKHALRCFLYHTTVDHDLRRLAEEKLKARIKEFIKSMDFYINSCAGFKHIPRKYMLIKDYISKYISSFHYALEANHVKFIKEFDSAENPNVDYFRRHGALLENLARTGNKNYSEKRSLLSLIEMYILSLKATVCMSDTSTSTEIIQFLFHTSRIRYLLAKFS